MAGKMYKNEQRVEGKITGEFIKSGNASDDACCIRAGSIPVDQLSAEYPNTSETATSTVKEKRSIPVKPVTVKIEDFRKDLNEVVAGSELPPFLLEMVLGEMLAGISSVAQKEYAQDREIWEKTCKEGAKNGGH